MNGNFNDESDLIDCALLLANSPDYSFDNVNVKAVEGMNYVPLSPGFVSEPLSPGLDSMYGVHPQDMAKMGWGGALAQPQQLQRSDYFNFPYTHQVGNMMNQYSAAIPKRKIQAEMNILQNNSNLVGGAMKPAGSRRGSTTDKDGQRRKSSAYRGVSFNVKSQKWKAVITVNKKQTFLGYFDSEVEAARRYDEASKLHRGPKAKTNFGPNSISEEKEHKKRDQYNMTKPSSPSPLVTQVFQMPQGIVSHDGSQPNSPTAVSSSSSSSSLTSTLSNNLPSLQTSLLGSNITSSSSGNNEGEAGRRSPRYLQLEIPDDILDGSPRKRHKSLSSVDTDTTKAIESPMSSPTSHYSPTFATTKTFDWDSANVSYCDLNKKWKASMAMEDQSEAFIGYFTSREEALQAYHRAVEQRKQQCLTPTTAELVAKSQNLCLSPNENDSSAKSDQTQDNTVTRQKQLTTKFSFE